MGRYVIQLASQLHIQMAIASYLGRINAMVVKTEEATRLDHSY